MVAETSGVHGGDGGFKVDAGRQSADEPASRGMGWVADTRGSGRPAPRRRLQLVVGVLGAVLAVVAVVHISGSSVGTRGSGSNAAGRPGGAALPVMLVLKTAAEREADLKAEDEEFCAEFEGFLHSNCMEKREKDRNAPKYWNANEVRNGLWKTEKGLADLEIRQYKHGKERATMHKEHEGKLKKFKARMEVALTLIHQIQDEMGTRHSALVERLKADIISTQARLKQYLDEGVEHVNGKVAILEEREAALTERLLEMVEAQYQMLNEQVDEVHTKEVAKDANVHAFIAGVEEAQQQGDFRIEEAINATRSKFEALKAREAQHYAGLITKKDEQAQKQAADVVTATTKIDTDVAALRANLTATLTADKANIRGQLLAGWSETNNSLAQLAQDAEAAAMAIEGRLSVQSAAQAANNAEQDEQIGNLENDLHVFNLTVFDEIVKMEGNASRFEQGLALAETTMRTEQETQKAEILTHINSAIAAVEQVHSSDKANMQSDVAWMKPKAAKVALELQEAIAAIEAQRQEDLAFLTGKLAANMSDVNSTYQRKHALEKGQAEIGVQSLAMALSKRRDDLAADDDLRTKDLGDRMTDYKTSAEDSNSKEGQRLAELRGNFTAEAARRVAELVALDTRAENVRAAMEAARSRLLDEHNVDMAAAKITLSTTLDTLITGITDLLQQEVATTDASITGNMRTQKRALARLDKRIMQEDARLNATEQGVRAQFEDSKNRTETRIAADMLRMHTDRVRWNGHLHRATNLHGWLDSNITAEFARLDSERVVILASLKWDLAAGLVSVTARVETELQAIEARQRTRLTGNKQGIVTLLATLANLQEELDANATLQVQKLHQVQAARDAAHSRVVGTLESGMHKDKTAVQSEINVFNATFLEAAARNTQAQDDVQTGMMHDEREVRSSFGARLAAMRAHLNAMITRSNVTELEDLSENVREVMMKASKLTWHMGARGADLRALLNEVAAQQQQLFGVEGARLQDINEAEVRAYQAHTDQLSVLQSRVGNEENELTEESLKLHQDLLTWDSTARDAVPPAVESMESKLDSNLQAQGATYKGALQTKVATQLARAQAQRSSEEARLALVASQLQAAKLLLAAHMPQQTALVDGASATITNTTRHISALLDSVEPVLSTLQTRLATVYDSIRALHAEAQAKVNADVRKGIAELGDSGLGEVSKEKLLLEALVAENMAEPEKALTMLQAKLNSMDTDFRNALSSENQEHGTLHDAVRVRLSKMERELRESNANLTSYVNGLKDDLDNWKTESTRALTKLERKQSDDKDGFVSSLLATKTDVYKALLLLRRKFNTALTQLTTKIVSAQNTLTAAHATLKTSQSSDKATIRRDVRQGVGRLQNSAHQKLVAKGNLEKKNIQTIISTKQVLVAELTQSTNKLIASMRNRVSLATSTEANDNTGQAKQLSSNDAIMHKWVRNSAVAESAVEARLDRIQERVKRRQQRAEADENILVAQLASKLQRQVAWLNSTFSSTNSAMVSEVQGTLGQQMSQLEKKLGQVRSRTLARLGQQKVALASLDKGQSKAIRNLHTQLTALQVRLKTVEQYSRGRTSMLVKDTEDSEANLRARLTQMMDGRRQQTAQIKSATDRTYASLQNGWTRRVETQRDWLSASLASRATSLDNRLNSLSAQLSSQIATLEKRLGSLSRNNDKEQKTILQRIARMTATRGAVEQLEAKVASRLDVSKAAVVSYTADLGALEGSTKSEVEALERKIDENQGISVSSAELLRTLKALRRDVKTLQTHEKLRDKSLSTQVRGAKTKADSTQTYLESQLARLERMLTHDSNERRRGRSQSEAKSAAYGMRMDRYRGDLTRINATWNAMDGIVEPAAGGAGVQAFDAPPAPPQAVQKDDGKSVLNAWCARFRDKGASYAIAKQLDVLARCYAQDCEQSLEGGDTNRPDSPGCRFLDGNGFCFAHGAAQTWCRDNARSPVCNDGGARWAAPPLGIAATASAALWMPRAGRAGAGGKTLNCACMKNCKCSSSKCRCLNADTSPMGQATEAFMPLLERPISVSSSKKGQCDCKCLAA